MKFVPFLLLAVIVFISSACEKQPLSGDPDPRFHKVHGLAKHESAAAVKEEGPAKSAEGPRSEEVPKFFPEKK